MRQFSSSQQLGAQQNLWICAPQTFFWRLLPIKLWVWCAFRIEKSRLSDVKKVRLEALPRSQTYIVRNSVLRLQTRFEIAFYSTAMHSILELCRTSHRGFIHRHWLKHKLLFQKALLKNLWKKWSQWSRSTLLQTIPEYLYITETIHLRVFLLFGQPLCILFPLINSVVNNVSGILSYTFLRLHKLQKWCQKILEQTWNGQITTSAVILWSFSLYQANTAMARTLSPRCVCFSLRCGWCAVQN